MMVNTKDRPIASRIAGGTIEFGGVSSGAAGR